MGNLTKSAKQTLDFEKILNNILHDSEELGSKFTSVSDMQEKMQTDATYFLKIQKEIRKTQSEAFEELKAAAKERQDAEKDLEKRNKMEIEDAEELEKLRVKITNDLDRNLVLIARQAALNKKVEISMKNISQSVDEVGAAIRDPSKLAASMLTSMGGWAPALLKASKDGKGLGGAIKDVASGAKAAVVAFGELGVAVILATGGLALIAAGMAALSKLFMNYWDFMDKKVIPAQAEFTKQIGIGTKGTKGLSSQMISTRR